jgi:hypothetical protein
MADNSSAKSDILAVIFPTDPKDRPSEDLLAAGRRVSGKDIEPGTVAEVLRVLWGLSSVQLKLVEDTLNTKSKDLQGQRLDLARLIVHHKRSLSLLRGESFREIIRLARIVA